MSLDSLSNTGTKSLRIEEIPKEELEIADDELLIPVAHYQKVCVLISSKYQFEFYL